MTSTPLADARRQDSASRRQRVLKVLHHLAMSGDEVSVSSVARAARVHRSFIYRHQDLQAAVQERVAAPAQAPRTVSASRESLMAELANAMERNRHQALRIAALEKKLSQALGETAWRETGLGAPADLDTLQRKTVNLEQQVADLQGQLSDQADDLEATRAANRELMAQINRRANTEPS